MLLKSCDVVEVESYDTLMRILPTLDPHHPTLIVNVARGGYEVFRRHIRAALALVSDFDGTLIAGSQWRDVGTLMRPELREADIEDAKRYFAGRERSDLSDIAFIFRSIERMRESGIVEGALELLARKQMPREGAGELFGSFDRAAIISYGMSDYIRMWRSGHGIGAVGTCDIFALELSWDRRMLANYPLAGCKKATVISDGNKGYAMDIFLAKHGLHPRDALVMGDAPTDLKMMMHAESCGVLMMPKIDPELARKLQREKVLKEMLPKVSAILVSDTLTPLVELRTT